MSTENNEDTKELYLVQTREQSKLFRSLVFIRKWFVVLILLSIFCITLLIVIKLMLFIETPPPNIMGLSIKELFKEAFILSIIVTPLMIAIIKIEEIIITNRKAEKEY